MIEEVIFRGLDAYLEENVTGFHGLISVSKFAGGQSNPTYQLKAASGNFVLRQQPSGAILKSAHAVDREYRVLSALSNSDVPVGRVFHLCTDRNVLGSDFYVMEYLEGDVFWKADLPSVSKYERAEMYSQMATVLSSIHSIDIDDAGLADFGRPGNYYERQISRWTKQYRAAETEDIPAMEDLIRWLDAHCVPDDGQVSLVHGDYRMDNLMFDRQRSRVVGVMDWELSTLGHPYSDLAYQCAQLRMPVSSVLPGLGGIDRQKLGIPSEAEYVEKYCSLVGLSGIPNWDFYLAFSYFRIAAILQGIQKRVLEGNASNENAIAYGRFAPEVAAMGAEVLEGPVFVSY